MADVFSTSGENSNDIAVPAPQLQGLFIPGIDNSLATDGFGVVTPWGGGGTARKYGDYGISGDVSRQNTQLSDLASNLVPAEGGGISYSLEGLIGPQGPAGRDGRDGIIHILGLNFPTNSNYLTALPHNIDQINDLGTAVDKLIYTDAYNTYSETTWTERKPAGDAAKNWAGVASDSDGSNLIAGIWYNRLYTSADYGVTWTERRPAGDAAKFWMCVASDADGSHLLVGEQRLHTSADSGATWTERQPLGDTNNNWDRVASDSDGSNLMAMKSGSLGRLYTSANYGADWTERQPAGDVNRQWYAIDSDDDGSNLIAGCDNAGIGGRLYTSANSGATWTERQPAGDANKIWYVAASDSDGSHLMAGVYGGRLYTSADSGATWTERRPRGDDDGSWWSGASDSDGSHLMAGESNGRLYSSNDYGVTWTEETPAGASNKQWRTVSLSNDGSRVIVAAYNSRLYTKVSSELYSEATWAEAALTSAGRALLDDADAAAQATTLGLGTGDSPEFAGLTVGDGTDALKVTSGVVSVIGSPTKNYALLWNGSSPVWAAQGTSFTFTIATFSYSGYTSIIEMGIADSEWKAIGALSFTATYNNGPPDATPYITKTSPGWSSDLEMTGDGYVGPTTNTEAVAYPSAINGNRQFTLNAESGEESDTDTKTVYFRNKKYFGFHSTTGQLDSTETQALSNSAFVAASGNNLDTASTNLTPSGSQYIHFVYPSRLDPSTIKFYLGGFETDFTDNGTFTFTNSSGFAETYRDYESPQAYDAATELVVSATP